MEQDVIQLCQPCFQGALNMGVSEWVGVAVLGGIALVSFFTKKNFFSMSGAVYQVVKGLVPKKSDKSELK